MSNVFLDRHSGKNYDSSREITYEQILALIEAARWSPSSHNDQPWNFIICDRTLTPDAYLKAYDTFKNTQQNWVQDVPLLVILVARTKQTYNGKFNEWAEYDSGAAAMSMSLQATDLGLMAHQIGGFDKHKLIENFQLPQDFKPLTIIAIGHETSEAEMNPKPRVRKPIHENFFLGEWGNGIEE